MGIAKILLVDDLKLTIEIAKSALINSGAAIITASNGADALIRIKKESPDLVLMDLFMPEMNGDECCKLIKEDPSISHIPVVLMSTLASGAYRMAKENAIVNRMSIIETLGETTVI